MCYDSIFLVLCRLTVSINDVMFLFCLQWQNMLSKSSYSGSGGSKGNKDLKYYYNEGDDSSGENDDAKCNYEGRSCSCCFKWIYLTKKFML